VTQPRSAATVEGLWRTISELARAKGITKGPLSRRVTRLEECGLLTTRPGERGTKLVNVAEFDRVAGETKDAVRELNGRTGKAVQEDPAALVPGDPILSREQARRAAYEADLKKLDLDERLGKLLPIEGVQAAAARMAEGLVRVIDQFPTRADEIAAAVAKNGTVGARDCLRAMARDLRNKLASEARLLEAEGLRLQAEAE
jgi:DNA-binding MarR family transcriptional regulator